MSEQHAPTQLELLETPDGWRLDRETRELGRKGVAEARRALQLAASDHRTDSDPARAA
jgi:hypothetical protein